jgi:hypothetical protein
MKTEIPSWHHNEDALMQVEVMLNWSLTISASLFYELASWTDF